MTRIAFIVNGTPASPMGHRARAFAERLGRTHEVRTFYRSTRKVLCIGRLIGELFRYRPRVAYVLDMGYSGVAAGSWYRYLGGQRLIIDTGDAITALARSLGRGQVGVALTAALERFSLRAADCVVVRGSYHRVLLESQGLHAEVLPDGVETEQFHPRPVEGLRRQLGLEGMLTVGLVGASIWSERLQTCYGWDLVELIRRLRDQPVRGVIVGDGSGIAVLQERCRRCGIEGRVHFLGRLPYEQLPEYLSLLDVCLSTQTDDLAGRVRTTGKLPLYMAAGRYVLASKVGEAAYVLPPEMLIDFDGQADPTYPDKLAQRVRALLAEPALLRRGRALVQVARERFDYDVLASRLEQIVETVAGAPQGHHERGRRTEVMMKVRSARSDAQQTR
jgi:glycosyltransferase involved in cell wall biosynthesis